MTTEKDFTITRVSWHTKRPEGAKSIDQILNTYYLLVKFLQENKLATRLLITGKSDVTVDSALMRSDLTSEGFSLIQDGYQKWLKAIDKGKSPEESLAILQKSLDRIRKSPA